MNLLEGLFQPVPDAVLRHTLRAKLLGWPLLIAVVVYVAWFFYRLSQLVMEPIEHKGTSTIDARWMATLMPVMYVPSLIVFSYCTFVGWKFFKHN